MTKTELEKESAKQQKEIEELQKREQVREKKIEFLAEAMNSMMGGKIIKAKFNNKGELAKIHYP